MTTRYEKECVFNKLKPRHLCNTAVDCTDSLDPPRLDRAQVQNWPNYAFVKPGTGQVARPCTWLLVVRNMMRPSEPRQLSTTSCMSVTDPTPLSGREVSVVFVSISIVGMEPKLPLCRGAPAPR